MRMYDIIAKKRDGKELSYEELKFFIDGYCKGTIPDYQASAMLMAMYLKGMSPKETADMTVLMANSGERIDLSPIKGIKVDKHSTGGVGDKVTLIVAPIVAACGVPVAKMSGRGLGHTGGTIDKLESIPGFRTSVSREEFISNVQQIGICIAGQTSNLAPADKKLYALRDVTATVNSIPLIASSIMSKKIASGANKIVLDVKTGSGAFMKTLDESIALSKTMVEIGKRAGIETVAVITDMDIPLGNTIGNALEVKEALNTLKGRGPRDLETISFEIAARMLELAGKGDMEHCREEVRNAVYDGSALKKFAAMVKRQGGESEVVNDENILGKAEFTRDIVSDKSGYIESIKTNLLGTASMVLGAGRETKDSDIDHLAGIVLHRKTGAKVEKGEVIATLHTNNEEKLKEAEALLRDAYVISNWRPDTRSLILAFVNSAGVRKYVDEI
ncbi:MAG TPA: pyrimidine-nucleoside phosphorylase [Clostridiaceae bacterium]|nr:pyrimidine-nucleoside phosphorylase [Clostridiaceae bacterium]